MNSLENSNKLTDNPWENLRIAIIGQAVKDYRTAKKEHNTSRKRTLKKFFLSEWGQALSYGQGEYIVEKLEKEPTKKERERARRVLCIETGVVYKSIGIAAAEYGVRKNIIYYYIGTGDALPGAGVHFKYIEKDGEKK